MAVIYLCTSMNQNVRVNGNKVNGVSLGTKKNTRAF